MSDRDSDARRDDDRRRGAVELEGLADDLEHALGDELGRDVHRAAVDEDHELVAAHPPDRVGVAQPRRQAKCDCLQELVAHLVAERVVDVLELVEVDEERRTLARVAVVSSKELLDPVEDQRTVGKPGQRVVERLVAQLVCPLADQPPRTRPAGRQHEQQRRQQQA